ncbi:MAG: hypothetical protein GC191_20005 [Azospirillum sp.]|nr:hypothetical protein [Azospirillum sp.]
MALPKLYTVAEAAAALGLPPMALKAAITAGALRNYPFGDGSRISEAQVQSWLAAIEAPSVPRPAPAPGAPEPCPAPPPHPAWCGASRADAGTCAGRAADGHRSAAQVLAILQKPKPGSTASTAPPAASGRQRRSPNPAQPDLFPTPGGGSPRKSS